jgi:hypothetical protein
VELGGGEEEERDWIWVQDQRTVYIHMFSRPVVSIVASGLRLVGRRQEHVQGEFFGIAGRAHG